LIRFDSITARLFWLSSAWLVVALVITAFLLTELYSRALDTSLTETLEFHVGTLVERTLATGDAAGADVRVADPRFDRTGSGWYWVIRDENGYLVNFSTSVVGLVLPQLDSAYDGNNVRTGLIRDAFNKSLRVVERAVTVAGRPLNIMVTGSLDEILALVDTFRGQTLIVLGFVGIMLAAMSAIVARIALRPVGRLRRAVEQVREGEQDSVIGRFPPEIAPLADEVNELLRSNGQIIERARNQVGNLAHGLKTPLAVLRNEAHGAGKTGLAKVVAEETEKMTTMVSSYLDKARIAARTTVVGKKTDATLIVLRLSRVMQKIHPDRTVTFVRPDASLPWFRGDEADLEEMAGNLLDNACKWSKSQVNVNLLADRRESGTLLVIRVEDDGPGLTEEQAQQVLRRGVRLDEKTPGSGLGLDIVKELVDVYGGSLQMGRSSLGGLRAELRLPSARAGRA
jgi:signal transduction histidine kinase